MYIHKYIFVYTYMCVNMNREGCIYVHFIADRQGGIEC